jgi:hypothetical protein
MKHVAPLSSNHPHLTPVFVQDPQVEIPAPSAILPRPQIFEQIMPLLQTKSATRAHHKPKVDSEESIDQDLSDQYRLT